MEQTTIVCECDREHRHKSYRQTDELFDPVSLGGLRIANLNRAKQNDTDGEQSQDPVEVAPTTFVNDCNHLNASARATCIYNLPHALNHCVVDILRNRNNLRIRSR